MLCTVSNNRLLLLTMEYDDQLGKLKSFLSKNLGKRKGTLGISAKFIGYNIFYNFNVQLKFTFMGFNVFTVVLQVHSLKTVL